MQLLVLVGLLLPGTAWAQRVVLVRQPSDPPLVVEAIHRLAGELGVHDFHVLFVTVDDGQELSPARLAEIAEREDAVASVAFVNSSGQTTADIWLSDRVTGKTSIRTLATASQGDAPSVLAIRAVDLLRLSLRELSAETPVPPEVVGAHPERAPQHVREWAEPKQDDRPWEVRTEIVGLSPLERWSPGLGLGVAVGRRISGPLSARLSFAGPSQGGVLESTSGQASARLQQIVGQAELGLAFFPLERLQLEVTGSAGVHHLQVVGEAEAPLVAASGSLLSFAAGAGIGSAFVVTPGVSIGVGGRVLLVAPPPSVAFGDETQRVGSTLLWLSAGLRVAF